MVNKKRPQPHKVRPALCEATRQKRQFLNGFYERLYCATLSLTAYYSTLNILLSRAFGFCRILPGALWFCPSLWPNSKFEFLCCENKLSAVRTYATKAVAVQQYGNTVERVSRRDVWVNRAVTPAAKLIGAARKNGWSSVRCRCGQTIKSKSVTTRMINLYNSRGGYALTNAVPCFI